MRISDFFDVLGIDEDGGVAEHGGFVGVGEEAVVDFELVGAGCGGAGGEFADYCFLKVAVGVFCMAQGPLAVETVEFVNGHRGEVFRLRRCPVYLVEVVG